MARTFSFYLAAPGDGTSLLEVLDVKDVADFLMLAIDRSLFGAFNLAARPMSFRDFLSGCKSATHSDAEFVWIPESFLREQGLVPDKVQNWLLPLPYYNPDPATHGFSQISSQKSPGESAKTRTSLIGASQRRRSPAGKNPPRQMLVRSSS